MLKAITNIEYRPWSAENDWMDMTLCVSGRMFRYKCHQSSNVGYGVIAGKHDLLNGLAVYLS
jgi:hypothetical protein